MLWNFLREEEGQDLIEYTLLLAFMVVAAAAIYMEVGTKVSSIWTAANGALDQAAGAAS
ncbi:MAG: Flp family type IVb pilin [Bryobacteraceae bacterium]